MEFMEPLTYCYFVAAQGEELEPCNRFAAPELFHGRPFCAPHAEFVAKEIEDAGASFVAAPSKKVRAV